MYHVSKFGSRILLKQRTRGLSAVEQKRRGASDGGAVRNVVYKNSKIHVVMPITFNLIFMDALIPF